MLRHPVSKRVPPGVGDGDCVLTRKSPPLIHSEMFCQGLLYMLLGDWFVCTCICRGAHTPVIHIHGDQRGIRSCFTILLLPSDKVFQ